jgi:hypothetical protein
LGGKRGNKSRLLARLCRQQGDLLAAFHKWHTTVGRENILMYFAHTGRWKIEGAERAAHIDKIAQQTAVAVLDISQNLARDFVWRKRRLRL